MSSRGMSASRPRDEAEEPDPYARPGLPSGTVLRFALLAIVVLTASLEMSNTTATLLFAHDGAGLGCWFAIGDDSAFWRDAWAGPTPDDAMGRICLTEPVPENPYAWGYTGTAVVVAGAVAVYRLLPVWRSRRRGLVPVEQLDAAFHPMALCSELDALVAQAKQINPNAPLQASPRFVVDCTALDASAVVFGRMRAPVVCLHAGLLGVRVVEPEKFRAVVLHELAHIQNFDVGLAYFVLALWRAFVALVLIPYVLVVGGAFTFAAATGRFPGIDEEFWPAALPELVRQAVKALVVVAVVFLARADTLRHRELVADAEAVRAGADPGVWADAASSENQAVQGPGRRSSSGRGRLRLAADLLRPHPSWRQRLQVIKQPYPVYGLSRLQFFLIGCTTLISANTVARSWGEHLGVNTVVITASAIVVFATWHGLMRARLAGTRVPSGLAEGLSLGCGLVVGQFAAGIGSTSRWWPSEPALPLVLVALPALATLWVTWIMQNGHLSLLQGVRPRAALTALGSVAGLIGLMLIGWWLTDGYAALAGHPLAVSQSGVRREMPVLAERYPGIASLIALTAQYLDSPGQLGRWGIIGTALWAYPVLVQLPRFFGNSGRRARTRAAMHAEAVSFRGVTAAGLAGGLIACGGIVFVAVWAGSLRPDSGLDEGTRLMLLLWWTALIIWGGSVFAAMVTAARAGPVWMPRAVTAAAIAHMIGLLGFVATMALGGCGSGRLASGAQPACGRLHPDLWESLPIVISLVFMSTIGAAIAAAGTAVIVGGIQRVIRRRRAPGLVGRQRSAMPTWVLRVAMGGMLTFTVASCHTAQEINKPPDPVTEALEYRFPVPSLSVARRTRSLQILVWARAAVHHVEDVHGHHNDVYHLLATRPLDVPALRTACRDLRTRAALAQQARPFPEPGLRARWADHLRRTVAGADACVAWTHAPTKPRRIDLASSREATINLAREFYDHLHDARKFWG